MSNAIRSQLIRESVRRLTDYLLHTCSDRLDAELGRRLEDVAETAVASDKMPAAQDCASSGCILDRPDELLHLYVSLLCVHYGVFVTQLRALPDARLAPEIMQLLAQLEAAVDQTRRKVFFGPVHS